MLASIWAEVLRLDRVGVTDNFFELGGHSLLAMRLIGRVRASLGVEVAIRSLFEAPSVGALALRLTSETAAIRAPLKAMPRPSEVPLSYAQRRLWFLDRLEGGAEGGAAGTSSDTSPGASSGTGTYSIPVAVRLSGALDRGALEGALNDLAGRHESLRTVFPESSGVPRQEVLAASAVRLALETASVTEDQLPAALSAAAGRGFDLSRELPLRAHLFAIETEASSAQASSELAASGQAFSDQASSNQASSSTTASEYVLLVVLHHIAGDGWSLRPLLRDLAAFYRSRLEGGPAAVPALPVQYADYTLWQRAVLGEEGEPDSAIGRQLDYWKAALQDLPEQIELPADRARAAVSSHRGGHVPITIDAELHRGLVALSRQQGASLFMVLQAGLSALLTRLGGGTDIALGSPIAGRGDAALDELVGFFVNTLVLRTDTSGSPPFHELIGRVRAGNLAAYAHQDLPFERLVEVLNPQRSLSRHPLFQVMLAFETEDGGTSTLQQLPGLLARPQQVVTQAAKFDLSVALLERRGRHGEPCGIDGVLEYAADLFDRQTVEIIGQRLVRLLEAAVADASRPIGSLAILEPQERATILQGWNDTAHELEGHELAAPGIAPMTLPALFAAQAARTPDATAVVFEDRELTYAALDAHANRLAQHLQSLGVGPETVVGLCVERSPEMVVGLLGILKAGGAYLPLDPAYPRERLAFMLEDARAPVLLTHSALLDQLPAHGARVVRLDADWPTIAQQPTTAPASGLHP
ncbi:MAG TPA: condensation domain-containing protein, partial [Planctomycetota bacterium]|nr:condensation domain-containing protein [Planctomycetota bacterium]